MENKLTKEEYIEQLQRLNLVEKKFDEKALIEKAKCRPDKIRPPFPKIPSYNPTAVILSYFDYEDRVKSLL